MGDLFKKANVLTNIGEINYNQGQFTEALKRYEEAHQIFEDLGYLIEEAIALFYIGIVYDKLGETLTGIIDEIKKVADIVAEINIASREQTTGIDQINNAVAQMDDGTQQNVTLVEASASSNNLLQDQAAKLTLLMGFFKLHENAKVVVVDS